MKKYQVTLVDNKSRDFGVQQLCLQGQALQSLS